MKHRNIIHIEKMGSNDQREAWEFLLRKGWERGPLGPVTQTSPKGLQLADAVISGPPTRLVLQLLANWKLEQTIARRVERKKNWNKKKACSKMYVDRKRKRKQKKEAKRKVICFFFLLHASSLIVPSIVRIRGSQLAMKKRALQTHILLITKPIIQKSGFEMGTIFNNCVKKIQYS